MFIICCAFFHSLCICEALYLMVSCYVGLPKFESLMLCNFMLNSSHFLPSAELLLD